MSYFSVFSDVLKFMNNQNNESVITGQIEPIRGNEEIMQVGKAGGYLFKVKDIDYLDRILILGTNKNTYYSTAKELTKDAIEFLNNLIKENKGELIVNRIKEFYEQGRTPKQDPLLMALAIVCHSENVEDRRKAYDIVSGLRTLSHVYTWKGYQKTVFNTKGFGKLAKESMNKMFSTMSPMQLAYQITKYPHRSTPTEKWAFMDLIRCTHLVSDKMPEEGQYVMKYAIKGFEEAEKWIQNHNDINTSPVIDYIRAVEKINSFKEEDKKFSEMIAIIYDHNLVREVIPQFCLKYREFWTALLVNKEKTKVTMPLTALIRNLGTLSNKEVFEDKEIETLVCEHIKDENIIKKARLHPVNILIAYFTYKSGSAIKGKQEWSVNENIVKALNESFYKSFKYAKPTNKRIYHAIDCSGSMTSPVPCLPQISACQAAGCLAMTFARIEKNQEFGLFTSNSNYSYGGYSRQVGLTKANLTPNLTFEEVTKEIQKNNFGSTDCSLPIENAIKEYKESKGERGNYDAFIVYTDNETYAGRRHPVEALKEYRELTNNDVKMVVIATDPSSSSIADPTDCGMLDIVGFDTNAPEIIMNFIRNNEITISEENNII